MAQKISDLIGKEYDGLVSHVCKTIPKENLYAGMNSFYVVVTSNTGKTQDRMIVSDFFAMPNLGGGTTVVPVIPAPVSGNGGGGSGI